MKKSKTHSSISNDLELLQNCGDLKNELKDIMEKLSSFNNLLLEEEDLNKIAKAISNRINDLASLVASAIFSVKSLYQQAKVNIDRQINSFSILNEKCVQLECECSQLKDEKSELITKYTRPQMIDQSENTDNSMYKLPDHIMSEFKEMVRYYFI